MGGAGTGDASASPLVLIVDDDFDNLRALGDALGELGFQIATAANGAAAMTWLEQATTPPAAILLDLMMRGDLGGVDAPIVIVEKPVRLLMLQDALGRALGDPARNANR
jgi:CheY-like chemotaxis protein